jgi:hypothetical protein
MDMVSIWPGQSRGVSVVKFSQLLRVFAVIGIGFKSDLLPEEGTIDADRYVRNLDQLGFIEALDAKHERFRSLFRQDGAHQSREALEWCEEIVNVIVSWPSNWPDLFPIELLCVAVKKLVRRTTPKSIENSKVFCLQPEGRFLKPQLTDFMKGSKHVWSFAEPTEEVPS